MQNTQDWRLIITVFSLCYCSCSQTILANQTLCEVFANRMIRQFPERKWDVEQVQRQLHDSAAKSELAGERLLVSELALLQLWDILRGENIQLLFKRS